MIKTLTFGPLTTGDVWILFIALIFSFAALVMWFYSGNGVLTYTMLLPIALVAYIYSDEAHSYVWAPALSIGLLGIIWLVRTFFFFDTDRT